MRFVLSLCLCDENGSGVSTAEAAPVTLFGKAFPPDYQGDVEVPYEIIEDKLKFRVPERGLTVSMDQASAIAAVLLRVQPENTMVQAFCHDLDMTLKDACCHGSAGTGCDCWGATGCSCVFEEE